MGRRHRGSGGTGPADARKGKARERAERERPIVSAAPSPADMVTPVVELDPLRLLPRDSDGYSHYASSTGESEENTRQQKRRYPIEQAMLGLLPSPGQTEAHQTGNEDVVMMLEGAERPSKRLATRRAH